MKNLVTTLLLSFGVAFYSNSQTTVYSEDFDGALTWTINTDLGTEGTTPNQWYISCEEEGVGAGVCGAGCGAGDQTLHISTNIGFTGDIGAAYFETGGVLPGTTTDTDRRAESGDISTVGFTTLTLEFDQIGWGGNADDYCELFYSTDGGGTWTSLDPAITSMCCGGVACTGAEQGLWETNTYALPTSCEGIPNLRISFVWKNLDDGVATDPSFAVDNIEITSPDAAATPIAEFTLSTPTTICAGDDITFTDVTTGGDAPYADWAWDFDGATPGTATGAGPHVVNFPTPGSYDITLTVTDGSANVDDTTVTITVNDCSVPTAEFSLSTPTTICSGDDITFTDLTSGGDAPYADWAWDFDGATPGTAAGAGPHVVNFPTAGTYNITLTVTDGSANVDDTTVTVTVNDCAGLTASFTPDALSICEGDCINMNDGSTGAIAFWGWTFSDPAIAPVAGMDPGLICFPNAGLIDVTLGVSDATGTITDDTTITIDVRPAPTVTIVATPNDTICEGDQLILNGSGAVTYVWDSGVIDGVPFFPPGTGTLTYNITGEDALGCQGTASIDIFIADCVPLVPGFVVADNQCIGNCITLQDTSSGNIVSWSWDFGGAATPNTSTDQNPTICLDSINVFDIQLTVTDVLGVVSSTTNSITVFDSPTVTATLDTLIDLGGQADLIAAGSAVIGSYVWIPDDRVDCDSCAVTFAAPFENTDYIVIHTDQNGCTAQDTVTVQVNFIEGIGVPTAFSPNGDGNNDVLYVLGFGIESMRFSVYNRYGQKVFETTDQGIGWDGMHHGKEVNQGVFTWVLEYNLLNGSGGLLKGNTTLIR